MRSRFERQTFRCTAAMLSGLLALSSVGPVFAQQKPASAAKAPAAKKAKKLTEKQAKEQAKKKYKEGQDLFAQGDYAGALVAFEEADDLVPGAAPKYRIAASLDKQNKVHEALDAYQKFLDASPDPDKLKDQIADAKARQDVLKKTPGKIHLVTDPAAPMGLKVAVDGVAQVGTVFPADPGHHTLTASADNFDPTSQDFDLTFAESKDLQVKLLPAAPKPPPPPPIAVVAPPPPPPTKIETPPPPPEPHSNVPAYVTLGLAVVGAGVGTVFGIQALGSKSDYNKAPTRDGLDKVERQSLLADMSYAVALTFGVTGVVLLLSNDDAPKQGHATKPSKMAVFKTVAPYVTPTGGGAAATLRF
jgi:hypothetical protein